MELSCNNTKCDCKKLRKKWTYTTESFVCCELCKNKKIHIITNLAAYCIECYYDKWDTVIRFERAKKAQNIEKKWREMDDKSKDIACDAIKVSPKLIRVNDAIKKYREMFPKLSNAVATNCLKKQGIIVGADKYCNQSKLEMASLLMCDEVRNRAIFYLTLLDKWYYIRKIMLTELAALVVNIIASF